MEWVLGEQDPGSGEIQLAGGSVTCSSDWFGLHPVLPTSVCFYNFESKCYICSIHFSRSDDMVEVCGALLHFCSGEMWPVMYFLCNTLVRVWLRAVMASVLFSRRV